MRHYPTSIRPHVSPRPATARRIFAGSQTARLAPATHLTFKVRHGLQAAGKQRQGVAGATSSPPSGPDPLIEMSVKRPPTRTPGPP